MFKRQDSMLVAANDWPTRNSGQVLDCCSPLSEFGCNCHEIKPAIGLVRWGLARDIRMNSCNMIMEERKHLQDLPGGRLRQSRTNHSHKRPLCTHVW